MTCKPKLPLLFSSHDDLRYSVSPGSCHPLWHRSHRRKSHIWHRRSHGLCDRPWRTLCTHLPHPPSYRCDSGTCRRKGNRTRLCVVHKLLIMTKSTCIFLHKCILARNYLHFWQPNTINTFHFIYITLNYFTNEHNCIVSLRGQWC